MIITQRPSVWTVAAGLPEFALGAAFAVTWRDPSTLGVEWVGYAMMLVILEFILIHANAFLGWRAMLAPTPRDRLRAIAGFGGIYLLFGIGISLAFHSWGPVLAVVTLTATRLWSALRDPPPTELARAWFGGQVGLNAVLYLLLAACTVFLPIPELGVKSWMYESSSSDPGLWEVHPQLPVFMACVFYSVRGLITITAWPRRMNLANVQVG